MYTSPPEQQAEHRLKLHDFQWDIFSSGARFKVVAAGRRTGKSFCSCVMALDHCLKQENRRVLMIGPTYGQAKEALWTTLKMLVNWSWVEKISESELDILFINGSRISLKGSDRPETLRGISPSPTMMVCDEHAFYKQGTWPEILLPMTSDPVRRASVIFISTPKGVGNEFHDLYIRGQDPNYPDWESWQFRAIDVRPDMAEEIQLARATLDPRTFDQEYGASFLNTGFAVFYPFRRDVHVRDDLLDFQMGEKVHVAIDFNVGIQASAAFAVRGGQMHWLKDYKGAANTQELAQWLVRDYPGHKIAVYPDPSGNARKTSAATGVTDFSILRAAGFEVLSKSAHPSIKDSVNAVNRMLEDANGNSNFFVHPRCKDLIMSLEGTQWKEKSGSNDMDTAAIDKANGVEHWSDGVRYACDYLFPIRSGGLMVVRPKNPTMF